jgi:hypothetical protein
MVTGMMGVSDGSGDDLGQSRIAVHQMVFVRRRLYVSWHRWRKVNPAPERCREHAAPPAGRVPIAMPDLRCGISPP